MNTEKIKRNVYYTQETTSTNTDAMNSAAPDMSIFLAEFQSNGKGSRGRSWLCAAGDGILMSILLFPTLPPEDIPKITLAAGVAVCKVIRKKGFDAFIKWPNDIVVSGKKVCGILTEKKNERVAVGIGLNVNGGKFDGELCDKATSLFIESGKTFEREELIGLIADEFDSAYKLLNERGFSGLKGDYKKMCVTLGKKIRVELPLTSYEAFAVDITDGGELLITCGEKKEILNSGEVSVRGIYGYV